MPVFLAETIFKFLPAIFCTVEHKFQHSTLLSINHKSADQSWIRCSVSLIKRSVEGQNFHRTGRQWCTRKPKEAWFFLFLIWLLHNFFFIKESRIWKNPIITFKVCLFFQKLVEGCNILPNKDHLIADIQQGWALEFLQLFGKNPKNLVH